MTHWGGVPTGESYDDKYYIGPKDDKPWTKDLNFKQRCQMEWCVGDLFSAREKWPCFSPLSRLPFLPPRYRKKAKGPGEYAPVEQAKWRLSLTGSLVPSMDTKEQKHHQAVDPPPFAVDDRGAAVPSLRMRDAMAHTFAQKSDPARQQAVTNAFKDTCPWSKTQDAAEVPKRPGLSFKGNDRTYLWGHPDTARTARPHGGKKKSRTHTQNTKDTQDRTPLACSP